MNRSHTAVVRPETSERCMLRVASQAHINILGGGAKEEAGVDTMGRLSFPLHLYSICQVYSCRVAVLLFDDEVHQLSEGNAPSTFA